MSTSKDAKSAPAGHPPTLADSLEVRIPDRHHTLTLVRGEPVKCGLPKWLAVAVLREFADDIPPELASVRFAWEAIQSIPLCRKWLDHAGMVVVEKQFHGGQETQQRFISEPYGLAAGEIRALVSFCDRVGCEFEILAESNHYPTKTVRIELWSSEQAPF